MPILKGIKRISPLDIDQNISIGVALPMNETNFFKGTETVLEQAKTNLINLLLTSPGERINLPDYGVGLRNLLFEQKLNIESLKNQITTSALRYVPNIVIDDVITSLSEDEHTLFVKVSYRSILDGKRDAIQLNFN